MTATRSLSASIQTIGRNLLAADAGCPDVELVRRFADRRDEAAFAALVQRHAGVVFGVCRRVLGHEHDAEDAFQATFLTLARKAGSLSQAGGVGNWLYGVAYNVARKARASRHRRVVKEQEAAARQPTVFQAADANDWQEVLDAELHGLPEKYRAPIVLCDLVGLTQAAAAAEVGCLAKTLGTRLSRGRALLAGRLSRRGVVLPAGAWALARCAPADAAIRLVGPAVRAALGFASGSLAAVPPAAAVLSEGAWNIMMLKSPKCVGLVLVGVVALAGLTRHATGPVKAENGRVASATVGAPEPPPAEPRQASIFDHIHQFFVHVHAVLGIGPPKVNAAKVEEKDKKVDLTGTWVKKEGEVKLDFTDKETLKIYPHGDNEVIVVTCSYTADKDGQVKAEITALDGKEDALEKAKKLVPVGMKFSFRWKVDGTEAKLDEVKGKDTDTLKSHLEADYKKK